MATTISNAEMAAAWDGAEGEHWTEFADRYDAVAAGYWRRFLHGDHVRSGDRVLDIGCGTGESVIDAAAVAASVVGVDLSSQMLDLARRRIAEAGCTNADVVHADAQVHPFEPGSFDIAISRFGAMFFEDPEAAFANLARAARPAGRLALVSWQGLAENEWLTVIRNALAAGRDLPTPQVGAPGPFGLADPDAVRSILSAAGYRDIALEGWRETLHFGSDADDAWSFMQHLGIVKGLSQGLDDAARAGAVAELRTAIDAHSSADGVHFNSAAWLITATRM